MERETLGKHRRAELGCLQQQSVFVSCCLEKSSGKGMNMVSSVMMSYSASPRWLAVFDWNVLWGAGELFWFKWHKCKSLKNIEPSCKLVFEEKG